MCVVGKEIDVCILTSAVLTDVVDVLDPRDLGEEGEVQRIDILADDPAHAHKDTCDGDEKVNRDNIVAPFSILNYT